MTRLNLDEVIGDNAEAEHQIDFKDEVFTIPSNMPWKYVVEVSRFAKEISSPIEAVRAGAVVALDTALEDCLGPEQYAQFMLLQPTQEQIMAVINWIGEEYAGMAAGESGGSAGSSRNTRGPRKLTSNGSTESISVEPQKDSNTA
jgi:hypothetical protein